MLSIWKPSGQNIRLLDLVSDKIFICGLPNSRPDEKRAKVDIESGTSANVSPTSPHEFVELKGSKPPEGRRRLGSMDSTGGQSVVSSQTSSHGSSRSVNTPSLSESQAGIRTSQIKAPYRPPSYYKDAGLRTSLTGPMPMQIASEEAVRLPRILSMEERQRDLDKNGRNSSYLDKTSSFEDQPNRRTATLINRGSGSSNQSNMTSPSSPLYSSISSVEEGFVLPPLSSMTSQYGSGNTNISAKREQVFQNSYALATGRSLTSNPLTLAAQTPFGAPPPSGNVHSFGPNWYHQTDPISSPKFADSSLRSRHPTERAIPWPIIAYESHTCR